jgi:SAM-dependent methyltransferase
MDDPYLSGVELYGDSFSQYQIDEWFADEASASYELSGGGTAEFLYSEWARRYGYGWVPQRVWRHVLGFGAARGGELLPVAADQITIVESSEYELADGLHASYVPAQASGDIAADDGAFDLAVSFGVLHHIPNVTHVLGELGRVLEPGGWLLVREPIVSMGDWTRPRKGLTQHERGIPPALLTAALEAADFQVLRRAFVGFPLNRFLWRYGYVDAPYNRPFWTILDRALATMTRWNWRYHATRSWHKIRPTSLALVAQKTYRQ